LGQCREIKGEKKGRGTRDMIGERAKEMKEVRAREVKKRD
jgi:hypothetical protein